MKCPIDGADLASHVHEAAIEVDKCPECGGVWLDHRELERIQDARSNDYTEEIKRLPDLVGQAYAMALARSKEEIHCPKCDQTMERREHGYCSQVLIDSCPHCRGIWLDHQEIGALEVFFERAHAETPKMRSGFFAGLTDFFG